MVNYVMTRIYVQIIAGVDIINLNGSTQYEDHLIG